MGERSIRDRGGTAWTLEGIGGAMHGWGVSIVRVLSHRFNMVGYGGVPSSGCQIYVSGVSKLGWGSKGYRPAILFSSRLLPRTSPSLRPLSVLLVKLTVSFPRAMMENQALLALVLLPLACCFQAPASFLPSRSPAQHRCTAPLRPAVPVRMQLEAPEKIKIPDTFNPAEWGVGGGKGGFGEGLGGFKVPDSFNPAEMEKEKQGGRTAVMDRPSDKTDPGKKYKVLLFNDDKNTRQYVIDTLMKYIPGMTADKAKEITVIAHNTGMAIVGVWMYEMAEAYSDVLRSAGLRSDIDPE
eukprot:768554-Hanusia_phi.AAC.3